MSKELTVIGIKRNEGLDSEAFSRNGLSRRGQELLASFLAGVAEVGPDINVLLELDEPGSGRTACACDQANTGERLIMIARSFLNRNGTFVADRMAQLVDGENEVLFDGFLEDCLFLCGVEEAHHAHFSPDSWSEYPDPDAVPMMVYDSQEHEFSALVFQLAVAKRKRMPDRTIECLERRIALARLVRERGDLTFPGPQEIPG